MEYNHIPLDSVEKISSLGGLLSEYYQYRVISEQGNYYERAIPRLEEGKQGVCKENIVYDFEKIHPRIYNMKRPYSVHEIRRQKEKQK
ncbi:hypothetical protein PCC9214_04755 [Planktothrix tepida]|uniref:Uncharacterized protein n=1 Tax=Planktothrix tepida PCC 9214 TaxID=671072 RepID=A0A1J1LQA1_9CYAN|nr:hypothetical protein [Planktothrix tepida]CAD5981143.1 hypothetical protein PCC9214_04755 [Planktothrix tepida]CUR33745.1 hypothetical protein PL9214520284 [Planktothrix tepida PCC 9214]